MTTLPIRLSPQTPAGGPERGPGPESRGGDLFTVSNLNFYYGKAQALTEINMKIAPRTVTSFIGPSGCGKSTFLRTLDRMYEVTPGARLTGRVLLEGEDIHSMEVTALRRRVGMVFQRPNPFPKSIYENVAYGLRLGGRMSRGELNAAVEKSLRRAALWDEVKDQLHASALSISGGQQQRLCIARALAVEPEALLLDEPCSALDPISTAKIEDLISELKQVCTIVLVTHNMQQAARVAEFTGFFLLGKLIEFDKTEKIFTTPSDKRTEDYITGRFG